MGIFEHMGFIVLWLAPGWFMVMGQNFKGYATSENEARQIINIITAGHCVEE